MPTDAKIRLIRGDITRIEADAIVNAANTTLLGGGGVDGAIHRAAGPQLLEECKALKGCRTGEAKMTKGYSLPARHVIHTVGPVWHGGASGEEALLESCYSKSLELAKAAGLGSIAFPSISTGAYRFPGAKAAAIALKAVKAFLKSEPGSVKDVTFVLFSDADLETYRKADEET